MPHSRPVNIIYNSVRVIYFVTTVKTPNVRSTNTFEPAYCRFSVLNVMLNACLIKYIHLSKLLHNMISGERTKFQEHNDKFNNISLLIR